MTLEVVPEELRGAAKKLHSAAEPLACLYVSGEGVDGATFGHVELAQWTGTILDYCRDANTQLSSAATTMAGDLGETADDLEAGEQGVVTRFDPSKDLFGRPGLELPGPSGAPASGPRAVAP
ncbi:hypothetical protein [Nocardioides houyundeii]|uniref:hypothetical protein n=1 Tax=Nocardioides houyundeii TaxID=2045452 RepID=UPI000C755FEF|nr:hypothetical protein [Nocardioides houyundeii]